MNWVITLRVTMLAFAIVTVYLAFTDPRSDYLFAAVVLMICAGFLAYRFRLKQRIDARVADNDQD